MPSQLGIEKGFSILLEFESNALQCEGIDENKVEAYFKGRFVKMVINFIIGITDPRGRLSEKDIKEKIKFLYSYTPLARRLENINCKK